MHDEIIKELKSLEQKHNIKILYAVESGSRAWGFASQNSDWDVRFIYVHDYDWYLSVEDKKDDINIILSNEIDLSGWELKKALLLYKKSNPPIMEWLSSPIVYIDEYGFAQKLRETRKMYFNPKSCIYHYVHMAERNYAAYFKGDVVRVKKYFFVLRPVLACSWVERTGTIPPMEFKTLLDAEYLADKVRNEIDHLVTRKMNGEELAKEERIQVLDEYVASKLEYFKSMLIDFGNDNQPGNTDLNIIFRETLKTVWGGYK